MKIEISESTTSTITKEHLNGETLLPDNVKTPKEVHNWILNLSNNDSFFFLNGRNNFFNWCWCNCKASHNNFLIFK